MLSQLNEWIVKVFARMELLKHESRQVIGNQRGAGAVEYGLIIGVVVLLVVGAAFVMREPLEDFFTQTVAFVTQFLSDSQPQ